MHLIVINGTRVRCDWSVLHRLLISWRMNGALILIALALATYKPTLFNSPEPYLTRIIFWLIGVYLTTLYWYLLVRAAHLILDRIGVRAAVLTTPITAMASAGGVLSCSALGRVLSLNPALFDSLIWTDFARNLLIAGLMELVIVTSIMPFFWDGKTSTPEPPTSTIDPPEPRTILFDEKDIHLASLLHVRSQEHYLEFVFDQTAYLLRGALKDFVALCDDTEGIQCHRSHWVAKKAVADRRRHDGNPVLVLSNATAVPIARGRLSDVKSWLRQHRPEI